MADRDALLALITSRQQGVLVTLKSDGRPQLSNIVYAVDDGTARISVTADRAKTRNLQRDPRASLYVTSDDFWSYAVAEGDATLSAVTTAPDDDAALELADLYRSVQGEHPNWDEYHQAMIDQRRQVVRLRFDHLYGMARAG